MPFQNCLPPIQAMTSDRATKGAANALLGRVQMQKGDYAAAKTLLLQVYGKYSLVAISYGILMGMLNNGAANY